MKSSHAGLVAVFAASATLAFAQQPAMQAPPAAAPAPAMAPAPAGATPAPAVMDGAGAADVTTVTAKIIAVDKAKRLVTLRGPMGKIVTIPVGPEVKNFAQIKKGDHLVVRYAEAVTVSLDKNVTGRSKTVTTTPQVTAPMGGMPGMAQAKRTVIVANVDRVDTATSHILVHGPEGRYVEVKVKDPAVLAALKVGDKIVLTYTEAVVIDVQAAK